MKVDIKKLEKLLKIESHNDIIDDLVKVAGHKYSIYENELFTIFTPCHMADDEYLPCIVSHTDTVSDKKPKSFKNINGVLSNPSGVLGADDRAGIYVIYEMMKKGVHAIFILTDLEECGGVGATACSKDDYFQELAESNISALIELDRENKDHCATYGYDNEELLGIFKEHGYNEAWGSYTDVCTLSSECDIACVNLSIGYYNQHTKKEYLVIEELAKTLTFMMDMPKELYGVRFEIEEDYMNNMSYGSAYEEVCCEMCGAWERLVLVDSIAMCDECVSWSYTFKEVG